MVVGVAAGLRSNPEQPEPSPLLLAAPVVPLVTLLAPTPGRSLAGTAPSLLPSSHSRLPRRGSGDGGAVLALRRRGLPPVAAKGGGASIPLDGWPGLGLARWRHARPSS